MSRPRFSPMAGRGLAGGRQLRSAALVVVIAVAAFSLAMPGPGRTQPRPHTSRPQDSALTSRCQVLPGLAPASTLDWEESSSRNLLVGDALRLRLKPAAEPTGRTAAASVPVTVCAQLTTATDRSRSLPVAVLSRSPEDTVLQVSLDARLPLRIRQAAVVRVTATAPDSAGLVAARSIRLSQRGLCLFLSSAFIAGVYLFLALAVHLYYCHQAADSRSGSNAGRPVRSRQHGWRILDPVVVSAGSYGTGSLSNLQLLWFTLIISWLLSNAWLVTGSLPELSSDLLWILGITGGTKLATVGTVNVKRRLSLENWNWLVDAGYLVEDTQIDPTQTARWRDVVLDNGVLDASRYQLVIFSFVVGISLLAGTSDLQSLKLPEFLRSLQGLSSSIFVIGKAVAPNTIDEFQSWLNDNKARLQQPGQALAPEDRGTLARAISSLFGPAALGDGLRRALTGRPAAGIAMS